MKSDGKQAATQNRRNDAGGKRKQTPTHRFRQPVLLAMSANLRPKTALWRAGVFAERTNSRVVVLVALPQGDPVNRVFPHRNALKVMQHLRYEISIGLRIWRWCNKNLLTPIGSDDVIVVREDLIASASAVARKLKAQLIVLSEQEEVGGSDIASLVQLSGTSVLLSRKGKSENVVVAATDMKHPKYPVLTKGAATAQALDAPLIVAHNVEPFVVPTPPPAAQSGLFPMMFPIPVSADYRNQRERRLREESSEMDNVRTAVLDEPDTVDALLNLARNQKAELIVVGQRRRSWLSRFFGHSVSERVVEDSTRSVLVVPLDL